MKVLIASIPGTGHLNPLLSIASLLVESGHEVAVLVNEDFRPAVEAAGHRFLPEIPNAQTSVGFYFETYPERVQKSPGMEMTGYDLVHFFARNIPAQSASLTEDKEEVSALVQWSGAGIDLRTNQATPRAISDAVDEIFTRPVYRERARQLSLEFASHNVEAELLSLIEGCVRETVRT